MCDGLLDVTPQSAVQCRESECQVYARLGESVLGLGPPRAPNRSDWLAGKLVYSQADAYSHRS